MGIGPNFLECNEKKTVGTTPARISHFHATKGSKEMDEIYGAGVTRKSWVNPRTFLYSIWIAIGVNEINIRVS